MMKRAFSPRLHSATTLPGALPWDDPRDCVLIELYGRVSYHI